MRTTPTVGPHGAVDLFPGREVESALAAFLPSAVDAERAALANTRRPQLLKALVGPESRSEGYIQGLASGCLPQLLRAVDLAVERPVVLRVVYGASALMPLRALSYVLPAVQLGQRLAALGGPPAQLEVVLTGRLGTAVNALSEPGVARELELLTEQLDRLLGEVLPGGYAVMSDRGAEPGEALAELVGRLGPATRVETLELLAGRGGSRSAEQTLHYAAAHVLLHDLGGIPLIRESGTAPAADAVRIDLGGLLERHFFQARRLILGERQDAPTEPSAPLVLTRHSVPPYLMARDGDISLRAALAGSFAPGTPLAKAAAHDLEYLARHLPPGLGELRP